LLEACDFYAARRSQTPGRIKSESKSYSNLLASKLLDRFLLHASISWHDATGRGPKPNKRPDRTPSGPYARFVSLSVAPLIREFDDFRPGLIDFSWSGLCQRLVKSIKVREIKLLNPPTR
jgi:hypothetical protein